MIRGFAVALIALLIAVAPAAALQVVAVDEGIYALVGEKGQRSPANLANNATFGVVITDAGAVLIDPGGSWKGAEMLHAALRTVTDKPVKFVINTGGQDHRWLGNGYWKAQGAVIIASRAAVADQQARASMQLAALGVLISDQLRGTEPVTADIVFDDAYRLEFGSLMLEIRHPGPAHTKGDSFVWLPARAIVFTGDIVYVERLAGVADQSNVKSWIEAFKAIAALAPAHVVPGHGSPTTLARATHDTLDYLVNLRTRIGALIAAGGDMIAASKVDQSPFKDMEQFEALAGRNAQQVFSEMEMD